MNCWKNMKCGREPGGERCLEKGECPAATEKRLNGINGGVNGGRACWDVEETECMENSRAKFTRRLDCQFSQLVEREWERNSEVMLEIRKRLKDEPI